MKVRETPEAQTWEVSVGSPAATSITEPTRKLKMNTKHPESQWVQIQLEEWKRGRRHLGCFPEIQIRFWMKEMHWPSHMYLVITLLMACDYHPGMFDDLLKWVELQITGSWLESHQENIQEEKLKVLAETNQMTAISSTEKHEVQSIHKQITWAKRRFVLFIHVSRWKDIMMNITCYCCGFLFNFANVINTRLKGQYLYHYRELLRIGWKWRTNTHILSKSFLFF